MGFLCPLVATDVNFQSHPQGRKWGGGPKLKKLELGGCRVSAIPLPVMKGVGAMRHT